LQTVCGHPNGDAPSRLSGGSNGSTAIESIGDQLMTTRKKSRKSKGRKSKGKKPKGKKPWEYIGEFVWNFGTMENYINEIFLTLFDLERVSFMFIGLIDTRKKVKLIEVGLKTKGDETHNLLLRQMHELADLRNVIAHSCFHPAQDGISIDHISHHGAKREDDYISYEEFERLFKRQNGIIEQLADLYNTTTPISSFSREFAAAIDEIIDASPNVIRYSPRRPQSDK
jgi:hypothetical protein